MKACRRVILFLLGLVLVTSCALLKDKVKKPDVKLAEVEVQSISFSDITLGFNLAVENPNSFDLNLSGLEYNLDLAGQPLTKANVQLKNKIPANGTATVPIPITLEYGLLLNSLKTALSQEKTPYTFSGKIVVSGIALPFKGSGELDLKRKFRPE